MPPRVKHPVGSGDEGDAHPAAQPAAQEGGDAGVGVDDVGPLLFQNVLQNGSGPPHLPHVPAVQWGLVVPDARGGDLRYIDAPVGYHDHIVALGLQLLGQLGDMGLRPADVHSHGGHQDLHGPVPLSPFSVSFLSKGPPQCPRRRHTWCSGYGWR